MRKLALSDEILLSIEKPARYIGNEVNSVRKDKEKIDVRFAMCFPDVYEIGMSHLGIQILYDMFNKREDIWCERVYSPWVDLDKVMREQNIPLFALESQDPIKDFDYKNEALKYVEEASLKTKLQDALIVLHKIKSSMEVVLLVKKHLKEIELREKEERNCN